MIHAYDDKMGIISIYSYLNFYHFSAFRALAFKAAGCGRKQKSEKEADTGPRLSQSKKLNPDWAREPNLG